MTNIKSLKINTDVLQGMPAAIALLDTNFSLIDASESLLKLFGLETQKVKGKNWFALFPSLSKDWKIRLEHTMYGVKDIEILDKVILPDGTTKHFIWHLNPWRDSSGKQFGVVITVAHNR
ncbi:PAS domain-containing protein [Maribacter sp.]|nr:PAS domain-containing protein [Maribacter sp.]